MKHIILTGLVLVNLDLCDFAESMQPQPNQTSSRSLTTAQEGSIRELIDLYKTNNAEAAYCRERELLIKNGKLFTEPENPQDISNLALAKINCVNSLGLRNIRDVDYSKRQLVLNILYNASENIKGNAEYSYFSDIANFYMGAACYYDRDYQSANGFFDQISSDFRGGNLAEVRDSGLIGFRLLALVKFFIETNLLSGHKAEDEAHARVLAEEYDVIDNKEIPTASTDTSGKQVAERTADKKEIPAASTGTLGDDYDMCDTDDESSVRQVSQDQTPVNSAAASVHAVDNHYMLSVKKLALYFFDFSTEEVKPLFMFENLDILSQIELRYQLGRFLLMTEPEKVSLIQNLLLPIVHNAKNIEKILKADRQNPNKAFIYNRKESIQAILKDVKMILEKISSPENSKDPGRVRKVFGFLLKSKK